MKIKSDLGSVISDLFEIYESELVYIDDDISQFSLEARAKKYFQMKIQDSEVQGDFRAHNKFEEISGFFNKEIIPLYVNYKVNKRKISKTIEKRNPLKYIVGAVIGLNIAEVVLTLGRSVMPTVLATTLPLELLTGYLVYKGFNKKDELKLNKIRTAFFKAAKSAEQRYETSKRSETLREILDGDLLGSEVISLVSQYKTPQAFWKDYNAINELDPASKADFEGLEVPRFSKFLELHLDGTYSPNIRRQRLDKLSIMAHEYFVRNNGGGVILN